VPTRRTFLRTGLGAAAACASPRPAFAAPARRLPRRSALAEALAAGDAATLHALRPAAPRLRPAVGPPPLTERFADLPRHFVFEYYPWYQAEPWQHWDQWHRTPPDDVAANYMPHLGAYDSRSRAVIEQHAQWIVSTGAGAVNLSWWGPDSPEDRVVPLIMDVMKDHGLKVTFHLEPYRDDHGRRMASDILYLLRRYGEARGWDAFLLLRSSDGRTGPVFKGFRTILPPRTTDCHGVTTDVADYTPDDVFARQLDTLRRDLRGEFDRVTVLADSVDFIRAPRAGFDGIAIYDNFIPPGSYEALAGRATEAGLVFSFNVNPGYDTIEPRVLPPDSCHRPLPFAPTAEVIDWAQAADRERAARLSTARISESFERTLALQTDSALVNVGVGFLLVYLNSFNEWHEGHAFEPMRDAGALTEAQRRAGYHNPARGDYRLAYLTSLLAPVLGRTVAPSARLA
jgi:hypothetical protein